MRKSNAGVKMLRSAKKASETANDAISIMGTGSFVLVSGGGRSLAGAPSEKAGKSKGAELAEGEVIEARMFGRG